MEIIKARGFLGEMYSLRPQTGYIMNVYRIINPLANSNTLNSYPVLYGHGVLFDSHSMISHSEHSRPRKPALGKPTINFGDAQGFNDQSLPFMLSNNNFDVWMFDSRATNDYSRNLTAESDPRVSQTYWDFSLDDQLLIDIPILIDFVLTKTAAQKFVYVGYSESTFFMFALMTKRPDYAAKVAAFVALAPVTYVSHIRGLTVPIVVAMQELMPAGANTNFLPQYLFDMIDFGMRNTCKIKGLNVVLCGLIYNSIGGVSSGEMTPEFFSNFFKSTSMKSMRHFIQLYESKRFGMYDYGLENNLRIYGTPLPPIYDLKQIHSDRIILARGQNDMLSTPEDQMRLIRELGTKPYLDLVVPGYNHFDFVDGKNLIQKVNGPVVIAIYELLYKDSHNILRTPEQIAMIIANDPLGRGGTEHIERLQSTKALSRSNPFDLQGLVQSLTGGSGLLNQIRLLAPSSAG